MEIKQIRQAEKAAQIVGTAAEVARARRGVETLADAEGDVMAASDVRGDFLFCFCILAKQRDKKCDFNVCTKGADV